MLAHAGGNAEQFGLGALTLDDDMMVRSGTSTSANVRGVSGRLPGGQIVICRVSVRPCAVEGCPSRNSRTGSPA